MASEQKGEVIDLTSTISRAKCRVTQVGLEVEGGWDLAKTPKEIYANIHHDGSVRIPPAGWTMDLEREFRNLHDMVRFRTVNGEQVNRYHQLNALREAQNAVPGVKSGEIASEPIKLTDDWKGVIEKWMKANYPHHVNETCGLHVHMAFRWPLNYSRLMTPNYQTTVVEYIRRWAEDVKLDKDHPLWRRLKGECEYCQLVYHATKQVSKRDKPAGNPQDRVADGHRYTAINYCYGLHQTVECRLLAMMETVEQSISAVQEVIRITNGFLLAERKREAVHSIVLPNDPEDAINEESIEFI